MKKISKILGLFILFLGLSCLISSATAFTISSVSVSPSGSSLSSSTPVTVSYKVDATGFPSGDDLQFFTELDNPNWAYTLSVNGIDNLRPSMGGKTLTITGFELAYKTGDVVEVRATLTGNIPASASPSQILLKVQEHDSHGNAISNNVYTREMPVTPTPTPTPAYGSISVSSTPLGANIYLDNAYKGLTNLPMDGIANGNHVVMVRLTGYVDWTQNVTVLSNATSLTANLVAITPTPITTTTTAITVTTATITPTTSPTINSTVNGSIFVQSSPTHSKVFLNNVFQGYTPMMLDNLTAGSTPLVTVRSPLYTDWSQNVAVTAGSTTAVSASLVLAPDETTATTTVPQTTVATVKTTVKSTVKAPTPWPSATPTPASPVGVLVILGAVGVGFIVIRKR